ncbi:MAG: hypothetical protein HYX27_04795 [Acidobacteria bacterium]|nr:hypothetical protein [Acidobacteriota bacterium]
MSAMDFIERLLGIAPDEGSGLLELLIFVSLFALAAAVLARKYAMAKRSNK